MRPLLLVALALPLVLSAACRSASSPAARTTSAGDLALENSVYERLRTAMPDEAPTIHVRAENGAVTLRGAVATDMARAQAESIASNTPGVQRVIVQLEP